MPLIDKLTYLRMMDSPNERVSPASDVVSGVLSYAQGIWPSLGLRKRQLKSSDIVVVYKNGDRLFFHVKAFARKMKDTILIVIKNKNEFEGHILFDVAAEYSEPFLEVPSFDFEGVPTRENIQELIPQIDPKDDNPFAILNVGEGTFMQTYRTEDGYVLEHQLVNTSSHYEIPNLATADQVVAAMVSYIFGNNEWLESFDWQLQEI